MAGGLAVPRVAGGVRYFSSMHEGARRAPVVRRTHRCSAGRAAKEGVTVSLNDGVDSAAKAPLPPGGGADHRRPILERVGFAGLANAVVRVRDDTRVLAFRRRLARGVAA